MSAIVGGRLTFVDLARAFAALMMVQGHALDVLLPAADRSSTAFHVWTVLRGQTSCLFLSLSGFLFTVATLRRWDAYMHSVPANLKRLRRLLLFVALGYILHFPAARIWDLPFIETESWRGFLAVDVLQCIGVSLFLLHLLALAARTPARLAAAAGGACLFMVALTPAVWRIDPDAWTPGLMAYLSPHTGSLFPLFPWSAYVFAGAVLGYIAVRHGIDQAPLVAHRLFVVGGLVTVSLALICSSLPWAPFGQTDFWTTSPNQFLLRTGLVALVLGAAANISRIVGRPHVAVRALAQESLVVYVVHVCLVYGSTWNAGLLQLHGKTTTLLPALGYLALLWLGVTVVATAWNVCKRRDDRLAWRLRLGVASAMVLTLVL